MEPMAPLADKDRQRAQVTKVEQLAAWQLRERKISAAVSDVRLVEGTAKSVLSSFAANPPPRWASKS